MPLLLIDTSPAEGSRVFWALLLLLLMLSLLVGVSVRRVGRDELVLVVRRGRVSRSGAAGWLARVPGLERFVAVPTHSQVVPLVVRGRTSDGVEVLALADLTLAVERVPDLVTYDDPTVVAARVAERVVADAFGDLAAVTLLDNLPGLEDRLPAAITRRLMPGSLVSDLVVTKVEAQLTPQLARGLRPEGGTGT